MRPVRGRRRFADATFQTGRRNPPDEDRGRVPAADAAAHHKAEARVVAVGPYRTFFLATEGFGVGRNPETGLWWGRDLSLGSMSEAGERLLL
jgi:hypothetical protein